MIRFPARLATLLAALPLIAACGGGPLPAKVKDTPSASPSTADAKPASPPKRPEVGACYRLNYAAATASTSDKRPTNCERNHTAVTVAVGTLDQVVDGHLLAVDSDRVQEQLRETCEPTLGDWLGGDEQTRLLSRFQVIWFSPTIEEASAGATWYRCDVVALQGKDRLARIDGTGQGVLNDPAALDRYGLCAEGDPASTRARTTCGMPHTWRAVTATAHPEDARHGDRALRSAESSSCRDTASERAADPLDFEFSFEWPTAEDWAAGQRVSYCWVPEETDAEADTETTTDSTTTG